MIELSGVSHRYEAHAVLREISVTLSERRVAIVGGNGSGKSTFARLLNGLQVPTEGSVKIDGLDTKKDGKEVRKRVGFVFQNPDNQIVFPVVEEDIAFGLKNLRIPKEQIKSKIESMLERYDLSSFRDHPSHLLSGGQKQLLAICGVLVMEPKYIVFDEPTTLLDLRNKRRISEAIAELDQSAIVVSHDLDFLEKFDRVLVFDSGRIVVDDEPSSALHRYVESMT